MANLMAALLVCAFIAISLCAHGVSGSAKSEFLARLKAETGDLNSLSTATAQSDYADYVERFGKLSGYLASDFDVTAHYAAYQENTAEIVRLNAAAQHEDEHYSINAFTDMTMEEKMAMLIPLGGLASRRRMGWADVDECITESLDSLPTDASSRSDTEMALNACGSVKSQGSLGSCWAFASTAQIQCNYNEEMAGNKVFSEKYATDCSDDSIGTVNGGGWMHKLTEWYDDNGACTSFHKEYDGSDTTEYNGDCGCLESKTYGECYALYAHSYGGIIAAAATEHAYDFAVALCNSFYSADETWYGCGDGDTLIGGHAMTIVGQQYGQKILVRNSWGTGWGMDAPFAGHLWFHKSVWSSAAGSWYSALPVTRTQFVDESGTAPPTVTRRPTFDPTSPTTMPSQPPTEAMETISCGQTLTDSVGSSPDSVSRRFVNDEIQSVTFTDCDSDFDPKMFLIDSGGEYIQRESTNNCDGDDCEDSNYFCGTALRETFTMSDLEVGPYTLLLTPYRSGGTWSMTVDCESTSEPTTAPTRGPTAQPTTADPTTDPTIFPTMQPTATTMGPSNHPTKEPTTGFPTMEPTTAIPTVDPTMNPTMNPTECECPDEPLPLEWLGWSPSTPLSECQGDCDYDSDCSGDLLCFRDAAPPGCWGTPTRYGDYCYDPSSSSAINAAIAPPDGLAPPEEYVESPPDSWTLTMAGKDVAILMLMAMNAVTIVAVFCLCSRSKRGGKGKYQVVVATEGDSDLEEVPLRL